MLFSQTQKIAGARLAWFGADRLGPGLEHVVTHHEQHAHGVNGFRTMRVAVPFDFSTSVLSVLPDAFPGDLPVEPVAGAVISAMSDVGGQEMTLRKAMGPPPKWSVDMNPHPTVMCKRVPH